MQQEITEEEAPQATTSEGEVVETLQLVHDDDDRWGASSAGHPARLNVRPAHRGIESLPHILICFLYLISLPTGEGM